MIVFFHAELEQSMNSLLLNKKVNEDLWILSILIQGNPTGFYILNQLVQSKMV